MRTCIEPWGFASLGAAGGGGGGGGGGELAGRAPSELCAINANTEFLPHTTKVRVLDSGGAILFDNISLSRVPVILPSRSCALSPGTFYDVYASAAVPTDASQLCCGAIRLTSRRCLPPRLILGTPWQLSEVRNPTTVLQA